MICCLQLPDKLNRCKQHLICSPVWPLQMFVPKTSITSNIIINLWDETMTSTLKNGQLRFGDQRISEDAAYKQAVDVTGPKCSWTLGGLLLNRHFSEGVCYYRSRVPPSQTEPENLWVQSAVSMMITGQKCLRSSSRAPYLDSQSWISGQSRYKNHKSFARFSAIWRVTQEIMKRFFLKTCKILWNSECPDFNIL